MSDQVGTQIVSFLMPQLIYIHIYMSLLIVIEYSYPVLVSCLIRELQEMPPSEKEEQKKNINNHENFTKFC